MAKPDGPRVDLLHPEDRELARLVQRHRDEKDGGSYRDLVTYYESRYGPLPPNHSMWNGEIGENDTILSGLGDGLRLGVQLYSGMSIPRGGGTPPVNNTTIPTSTGGSRVLDTLSRGREIYDRVRPYVDAFGRMAGGAADQRAEDRGAQAEYDVARVPVQNAQALTFAQARTGADRQRLREIGSADMLTNFKAPADPRAQKFLNNGQLSGGQMNPETIALMRERAMKALESGSDVPQLQTMPDRPGGGPTGTDSFLNTLRYTGTVMDTIDEWGRRRPQGQTTTTPPPTSTSPIGQVRFPNEQTDVPWWSPLSNPRRTI